MLQARFSANDDRFYHPGRDVAHCFADVMRIASGRLEDGTWPAVTKILAKEGVGQEELGKACEAFCLFVMSAVDDPEETMTAALARSGFWNVPEAAQVALMATVGSIMAGYYFKGARDATIAGKGPALYSQDLRAAGAMASKLITIPWWRKKLHTIVVRIIRAWYVLLGR